MKAVSELAAGNADLYRQAGDLTQALKPEKGCFAAWTKTAAAVTVFTTAALLVSYRRHGTDWWDYLDTIETALEAAAPLSPDVLPALLFLTRRKRARSG